MSTSFIWSTLHEVFSSTCAYIPTKWCPSSALCKYAANMLAICKYHTLAR